jgi:hypothetical protein
MRKRFSTFLNTTSALPSIARFRSTADGRTLWYRSQYTQLLKSKPHTTPSTGLSWDDTLKHIRTADPYLFWSAARYLALYPLTSKRWIRQSISSDFVMWELFLPEPLHLLLGQGGDE